MLREPRLVDPVPPRLNHQNQLEQVPLRFCASHGTKVVVWPHMPHVVLLTAVLAALGSEPAQPPIKVQRPLAIPVPFLHQVSVNVNSPF